MTQKRVLGVDPGSRVTGYGIVEEEEGEVADEPPQHDHGGDQLIHQDGTMGAQDQLQLRFPFGDRQRILSLHHLRLKTVGLDDLQPVDRIHVELGLFSPQTVERAPMRR